MKDIILHLKNINKSYARDFINQRGNKDSEKLLVLDNLNLELERGKITALIGGNGSGKTTLLNVVNGLMPLDSGKIFFIDDLKRDITTYKPHQIANMGIGRSFQGCHVFPDLTVLENLMIANYEKFGEFPFESMFSGKKNRKTEKFRMKVAEDILVKIFGYDSMLYANRNSKARYLSYGQQRLIVLTRLFLGDYKLVLIDEPTSGINLELIEAISKMLKVMVDQNNLTVFFIEHNIDFVKSISDQVVLIDNGRIMLSGKPEEILHDEMIQSNYIK